VKNLEVPDHLYAALRNMVDIFVSKGQDYSHSDDAWASNFVATSSHFGIQPWQSADFNELQKLARLSALHHRGKKPNNETVIDTYLDKAVYALIAYALLLHHEVIAHPIPVTSVAGERPGERIVVVSSPTEITGGPPQRMIPDSE
jgi:hypothetical protein